MVSSVPMGDSELVKFPDSEVRGNFTGQSVAHIKPNRLVLTWLYRGFNYFLVKISPCI